MNTDFFYNIISRVGPDHNPVSLRALVPNHKVGAFIGVRGNVHRQIQNRFEVMITMEDQSNHRNRLVTVLGDIGSVASAWREILYRLVNDKNERCLVEKVGIAFLIPTPLVIWLLEQHDLEKIHKATNTDIHLGDAPLKMTTEYLLTLSVMKTDASYLRNFEKAAHMLASKFLLHRHLALSPLNVYYKSKITIAQESARGETETSVASH